MKNDLCIFWDATNIWLPDITEQKNLQNIPYNTVLLIIMLFLFSGVGNK